MARKSLEALENLKCKNDVFLRSVDGLQGWDVGEQFSLLSKCVGSNKRCFSRISLIKRTKNLIKCKR